MKSVGIFVYIYIRFGKEFDFCIYKYLHVFFADGSRCHFCLDIKGFFLREGFYIQKKQKRIILFKLGVYIF